MKSSHLLPSNANSYEKALSLAAQFGDDILPEDIKTLWRPQEAAARFLPFMAWGLHVDFWRDNLPEAAKRNLISGSYEWHRIEGTFGAIRRICEAAFGKTDVKAWYEYGGQPYGFKVFTEGRFTGAEDWEVLQEAIWFAQALRDSLDGVEIQRTLTATVYHRMVVLKSGQKQIGLPPLEPKKTSLYAGFCIGRGGKKQIGLPKPKPLATCSTSGIIVSRSGRKTIGLVDKQKVLLKGDLLWANN